MTGSVIFYKAANVTEITTQALLAAIGTNEGTLAGKYILLNDIPLIEGNVGFDGDGWLPIGNPSLPFTGVFEGNSHKITNLQINRPFGDYVGLFGAIASAKIKNLGVEIALGKKIKGSNNVGGIAGAIYDDSYIINSYSTGSIEGNGGVGGIVGVFESRFGFGYSSNITNSYSTGDISGNDHVGGIAGIVRNKGLIANSYSTGDISSDNYVGGIAGAIEGNSLIADSYSTGDISGNKYYVGGIAGHVSVSSITSSYSTGNVRSIDGNVGGIAGVISYGNVADSYSTGSISGNELVGGIAGVISYGNVTNSYSIGSVSGNNHIGGIAGAADGAIVKNNAAINQSIVGIHDINRIIGVAATTTASYNFASNITYGFTFIEGDVSSGESKDSNKFFDKATYETDLGWDFASIWKISSDKNNGYPQLIWQD
ncbi:MAG: hypothetical protein LBT96_05495 [Campylobacteraceae bacterium]|nr:hypothetical protein [Campylobacteraceae bacterium]